ncbi:hypothetical protein Tco_1371566 [Tanacetum coccineum]
MEECHLLLTDKIDLTNPGDNRVVPDVSKPLPLGGPLDFGLEELVPSLWIESERDYDISAAYDISHCYQTKLNLTQPTWDASDFLFKEDYIIIHKPRAIIYIDRNNQKMMMRESKVHKFSDGTLARILEKLDHMVKDFRLFKFNSGIENRIWSEDDKRRSKEFIEVIEKRLKIRRIFRNLIKVERTSRTKNIKAFKIKKGTDIVNITRKGAKTGQKRTRERKEYTRDGSLLAKGQSSVYWIVINALLDEGSKILHSIEGTILEEKLFAEFDEFMAMTADENSESESDTEEPPIKKITFDTDYKIKTSLEEPPSDLELKPLPDNLEYVFLEEPYFLPVIISS